MKNKAAIQMAHDTLIAILVGEAPNPWADCETAKTALTAATDVLCWVLEHDHNTAFADNLEKIGKFFASQGCGMLRDSNPKDN